MRIAWITVIGVLIVALVAFYLWTPAVQEFELKQLGVSISPGSLPPSLTYDARTAQGVGSVLFMTTEEIRASAPDCYLGAFYRIEKAALVEGGENRTNWTLETLEAAANATTSPPSAKEFDDFFLVFEPSQAVCSGNSDEPRLREALWMTVTTAKKPGEETVVE